MSRVSSIDATGARVLDDAIRRLERRGVLVLLSGLRPGHDRALEALGVADRLRSHGAVFPDGVSACPGTRPSAIHPSRRERRLKRARCCCSIPQERQQHACEASEGRTGRSA
jgi:SulP family sulfate permease